MKKFGAKVATFFRNNAVYILLSMCMIAVGLSVTLFLLGDNGGVNSSQETNVNVVDKKEDTNTGEGENEEPKGEETGEQQPTQVIFSLPVESYTLLTEYSDCLVFNSTLNRYSSHKAMDFFAEEGTKVYAVYDGTIESVDTTLLTGTTVVIDHGNGLKSVYNSIIDTDNLVVGNSIKQGDFVGTVSTTNRQENNSGAHLHFSVIENDSYIDPEKYLAIDNK